MISFAEQVGARRAAYDAVDDASAAGLDATSYFIDNRTSLTVVGRAVHLACHQATLALEAVMGHELPRADLHLMDAETVLHVVSELQSEQENVDIRERSGVMAFHASVERARGAIAEAGGQR